MASSFGSTLRVSIFGQSHSAAIGCVVEGLPVGFALDQEALARFMARRAPGTAAWTTPRKEADHVQILSGLNPSGRTCGTPLAAIIENTNTRSGDYDELRRIPRPGHADFAAQMKYGGEQDVAGGGHFSARLTAPLCIAGGLALQILASQGVRVAAHVLRIASISDEPFAARQLDEASRARLSAQMDALADGRAFPTISADAGSQMKAAIDAARRDLDSLGGIIECVATGFPAGIGGPIYDGIESSIARIAFGIPAVKGIEFGAGFSVADTRGSENNDPIEMCSGVPQLSKNDCGGNLGGISSGSPVLFRLAVKPTPSIAAPQQSVDLELASAAELHVHGRHDPCVAPRAVPIAEALMALALLDSWLSYPPASASPLS